MAADTGRVSFGIKTSQAGTTYDQILQVWREAEAVPEFEHARLWDHLVPLRGEVTGPALEAWTLLAALVAQTSRLRLGVIVTSNRIRPPAVLAKMPLPVFSADIGRDSVNTQVDVMLKYKILESRPDLSRYFA